MKDSKAPGMNIKGRRISIFGIKAAPEIWMIFDEPEGYSEDEQSKTCRTYNYRSRLHVLIAYRKIIKAYARSKKDHHEFPIRFRR